MGFLLNYAQQKEAEGLVKTQYPEQAPHRAVHRIEIDLVAAGGFKATVVQEIGGNLKGGDLFIGLVDELSGEFQPDMEIELNAKHCRADDPGEPDMVTQYVLYNESGESVTIGYEDIVDHIVGMRIAACWPEVTNRAVNPNE